MNLVLSYQAILRTAALGPAVDWLRRHFDLPLAEGDGTNWSRLGVPASGLGVLAAEHGGGGEGPVVELEVTHLKRALARALEGGAEELDSPLAPHGKRHAVLRIPGDVVLWLFEPVDEGAAVEVDERPLGEGPVGFTVGRRFGHDVATVFSALTEASALEQSYLHRASGDLRTGEVVEWWWNEKACSPQHVDELRRDERVDFTWTAHHCAYRTRVTFSFTPGDDGCRVGITESGWVDDGRGRNSAFAHAEAWTELLVHVDVCLRHDLRLAELAHR
ncbi:MAG: SRPBCC domain-containing protein [Acidobacteriota bacterium]